MNETLYKAKGRSRVHFTNSQVCLDQLRTHCYPPRIHYLNFLTTRSLNRLRTHVN